MGRVLILVVAACLVLAGCGAGSPASSQAERQEKKVGVEEPEKAPKPPTEKPDTEGAVPVPADVPAYSLTKDERGTQAGLLIRSVAASTDATSGEDLEAITRELWAEGPPTETLQVLFYPNGQGDTTGTGMAFEDEETARTMFQEMGADPEVAESDVQKAMRNDGIYVIPTEEMVDEVIAEECAKWDTTTLGPPPPEWDCP